MNIFDTDITKVPSRNSIARDEFDSEIRPAGKPLIFRGNNKCWARDYFANRLIMACASEPISAWSFA